MCPTVYLICSSRPHLSLAWVTTLQSTAIPPSAGACCSALMAVPSHPLGVMLGDQLSNHRDQGGWHFHHSVGRLFKHSLILRHRFGFGLLFVVRKHLPHSLFVPT